MVNLKTILLTVACLPLILAIYLVLGAALLVYPELLEEANGNSVDPEDWQL